MIYTIASRTYEEITPSGSVPRWLPNGRRLLYTAAGGLSVVDVATKISRQVHSSSRETLGAADVSQDAREIYVVIAKPQSDIVLAKLTGAVP